MVERGGEVLREKGEEGKGLAVMQQLGPHQSGGACQGTYPTWWMCMPLLVGLAGADWVREDVSRIRWGRAFTVAYRNKGGVTWEVRKE